jgi:hypothetical protein
LPVGAQTFGVQDCLVLLPHWQQRLQQQVEISIGNIN